MIPQDHRDRANRADPYTEPNSCFSDSSDSLNSLNSLTVPLHLEKSPMFSLSVHQGGRSAMGGEQWEWRGYLWSLVPGPFQREGRRAIPWSGLYLGQGGWGGSTPRSCPGEPPTSFSPLLLPPPTRYRKGRCGVWGERGVGGKGRRRGGGTSRSCPGVPPSHRPPTPPPPPPDTGGLTMLRAVWLLRLRRRTFLFNQSFHIYYLEYL